MIKSSSLLQAWLIHIILHAVHLLSFYAHSWGQEECTAAVSYLFLRMLLQTKEIMLHSGVLLISRSKFLGVYSKGTLLLDFLSYSVLFSNMAPVYTGILEYIS